MNAWVWTANLLGWPLLHFGIGSTVLRLPASMFARDSWLTRERAWERGGALYRSLFAIHRWKKHLPDGAPWMGGMSKKRIAGRSPAYLDSFAVETRRAELAHWCMLLCTPLFFLWNPPWACVVMVLYGAAANIPCILAQRSNRAHLRRILARSDRGEVRPTVLEVRPI